MTTWRDIPGWEGLYQVSAAGDVRSVQRIIYARNRNGVIAGRRFNGRLLKPNPNIRSGYLTVTLSSPTNRAQCAYVHDLVALAFLGEKPAGLEVCHGDGARQNNRLENLRYGTRRENSADRRLHGTVRPPRGEHHPHAKLRDADVRWIRSQFGVKSQRAMGALLGVSHNQIGAILRGVSWTHVPR